MDPFGRHPRFQQLAAYLASKAPPGKLPGRQHIDPIEIPRLLPYLTLVDVVRADGPPRYRFRLVGTDIVNKTAVDLTGRWVEEAFSPNAAAAIVAAYHGVVRTRAPHHWASAIPVPGREHVKFERIVFPLAQDGETVDMLVGIHVFTGT